MGTARGTKYGYGKNGKPFLTKEPKLLLNDNFAGKPVGIHMVIGRRPIIAFGNLTGDRQMLEFTKAGGRARLALIVLHDDATREYVRTSQGRGPSQDARDSKVQPGSVSNQQRPGRKAVSGLRKVKLDFLIVYIFPFAAKVLRVG